MRTALMGLVLALAGSCTSAPSTGVEGHEVAAAHPVGAGAVNAERLLKADSEPGSWLSVGRTYWEQRFSPLNQINDKNVANLGLAWFGDIDTERGQESTPVVVDGVMYLTTAWSMVKAYDIRTGSRSGSTTRASTRPKALTPAAMS